MKNLYRRYRPLKLEDVVGQEQVTKSLANSLKQGKIGHAYLLVGPRGCGKTSVARILAHEVNGFKYEIEDDYVDIIEIDGASNRGIDNIRELREKVAIAPSVGKYKVYIIDEVHMLTKEAFNALLKTLEEPPEHAIFIMATTDAYKVPVTITSRAQTYTFKLAEPSVIFAHLKGIANKEKIDISDEALGVVVKKGGGSFRDSLSLLDQISTLSDGNITKEMVIAAMGLPEDEKIDELLQAYQSGDVGRVADLLKEILSSGTKPETLTEELIAKILDSASPALLPLLAKLPDVKAPYADAKLLVALTLSGGNVPIQRPPVVPAAMTRVSASEGVDVATAAKPKTNTPEVVDVATAAKTKTSTPEEFDWTSFTDKVRSLNEAIYMQLMKTKYEYRSGTLHIYPMKRIVKSILTRDNNKRVLCDVANGVKITIHEIDELPDGEKKDETLMKISAIMGGEVKNDGGGNPF